MSSLLFIVLILIGILTVGQIWYRVTWRKLVQVLKQKHPEEWKSYPVFLRPMFLRFIFDEFSLRYGYFLFFDSRKYSENQDLNKLRTKARILWTINIVTELVLVGTLIFMWLMYPKS